MPRTDAVRRRLQEAALELYADRGYDATTVAAIAQRADVTERTFFRHFPDKREVLFAGEGELTDVLRWAVERAPAGADAVHLARAGVLAVAGQLQDRRTELSRRESVVAAHTDLRQRERAKLAGWQQALDAALRQRGVAGDDAALTAGLVIAVLEVTARSWLTGGGGDLPSLVGSALARAGRVLAPARD